MSSSDPGPPGPPAVPYGYRHEFRGVSGLSDYLRNNFWYYKEPEGHDPVGKLVGLGQYGLYLGTYLGIYDAVMWSHCTNAAQFLNTWGFYVAPLVGGCVAYTGVTYAMTHLRGKDDKLNCIAGACASGGVLHNWLRCWRTTGWGTLFMIAYATLKKQNREEGKPTSVIMFDLDYNLHRREVFPWRNDERMNFSSKPWYPHDKTDYYVNHF